ncbi:nuclear transport factor 2 family protein [Chengkuizengella axinellae]|uniref:Nuclear transport factor 2 family protein n=1 Tax=Chengkuizengella axinellae TaxID=3064388 RepID=A0ABT9IY64_9BACL|nr:nuclear transport factor 2 family protein [Chengkuizengella sp. 2205SS18-9]MDP5274257.1 nuclear transport factor 2 family protein [Chengkuizengella sp. 2205SS18-9]
MEEIKEIIDDYFRTWNDAFVSQSEEGIRAYMSKSFIGHWAHSDLDIPMQYRYDYNIQNVLEQYGNAKKSFEPSAITERKDGKQLIVVGRETNMINEKPYRAQCMLIWQKEDNEWKLLREYIELER